MSIRNLQHNPLVIGHRGASREAPENTLAAFRLAFEQGADGVEADFRLTGDGAIVCLHDDSTGRTAGVDLTVQLATDEALRRLEVGSWKGENWRGEPIPTLEQVLLALPAGKMLFIELKSGPQIIPRLAATLAGAPVPPAAIRLLCFSAELIRELKERLPAYRACWLTDYRFRGAWHPSPGQVLETLRQCRADGLASRSRSILEPSFVAALRQEGREIHVWTVDAAREARRLCGLGVDSIMTNRPGWLRRSVAELAPTGAGTAAGALPGGGP